MIRIAAWASVGLLGFAFAAPGQGASGQGAGGAAPIEIHGRAIAIDLDGNERTEDSGSATVWVNTAHEGKAEQVEISHGRWTLTVPRDRTLSFSDVILGSRFVLVAGHGLGDAVPIPNDGVVTIRGKWLPKTTFRVIDAATGAELHDVDVVTGRDYPHQDTIHPTGQSNGFESIASKRPSPLDIRWRQGSETRLRYWVRAPGYSWATFEFDHKTGGEQTVKLVPAAELTVTWKGAAPKEAAIRLYSTELKKDETFGTSRAIVADSRPHRREEFSRADAQFNCSSKGSVHIDSMPPGRYILAAEVGEWRRRPLVVDEREIELAAGANGPIEVAFAGIPKKTKATIAGILSVAPGDPTDSLRLVVESNDALDEKEEVNEQFFVHDMKPIVGKPGEYEWSLEDVATGSYTLRLEPTALEKVVKLPSEGLRGLRIEAPRAASVTLHVVDDDTGKDVFAEKVTWYSDTESDFADFPDERGASHFRALQPLEVEYNVKRGVWEFAAYAGKISIQVEASKYAPRYANALEVHPGKNVLTVRLPVPMGVRVRVIDKETKEAVGTDFQDHFYASVEAVEPVATERGAIEGGMSSSSSSGERTLYVDKAGKYRVRLEPPKGYKKPKNKVVVVEKGKFLDVTFELEKK